MIEQRISGIYNYCDRWCERCPFQECCDVFQDVKAMQAGNFVLPYLSTPDHLGRNLELDLKAGPEEEAEAENDHRLREARTMGHPISVRSTEYNNAVRVAAAVSIREATANDPILALASETVRVLALPIQSKSRRAVHELVDPDDDAVDRTLDPRGIQSDGNGSAKVARLLIKESIAAWRVLGDRADEVPDRAAHIIQMLEMLDDELRRAFPFSLEFVRPGFDSPGAPS